LQQLGDLLQREPRDLGRADEMEPANLIRTVTTDTAARPGVVWSIGRVEEASALVVADRLNPDVALPREPRDRHAGHVLTPYYGTDAI
jgi:hypothetical protein